MLLHLVLLNWQAGTSSTSIAAVRVAFDDLKTALPEIHSCRHGPDAGIFPGADYVVVMEFVDEQALQTYVRHPLHRKLMAEVTGPIMDSYKSAQLRVS